MNKYGYFTEIQIAHEFQRLPKLQNLAMTNLRTKCC